MSDFLAGQGIAILQGYRAEHVTDHLDLVVVGNAISRGNPELETVLDRKLRYCSLPEAVRDYFLRDARSIVIAGTHGKTTTTALTGWLLIDAGRDPSVFVGGIAANLGPNGASFRVGSGGDFVIEGDEYDSAFFDKTAKFLKYLPDVAVVNNIEFDHADIYRSLDEIRLAFRRLVLLVPRRGLLLLGADSPDAAALATSALSRVETFGLSEHADWQGHSVQIQDDGTRFGVRHQGKAFGIFMVPLVGAHNVRNALAALAVGAEAGLSAEQMAEGLRRFRGVKRRLEVVGEDPRRHGDRRLRASPDRHLRDAGRASTQRIPHEGSGPSSNRDRRHRVVACSRTRLRSAFGAADEVVIAAVHRSTLPEGERLSPVELVRTLEASGRHARFISTVDAIVETVAGESQEGDLVIIMSNGGFGGIHRKMLTALAHG